MRTPTDPALPAPRTFDPEVEWAEFNLPAEWQAAPDHVLPVDPRELSHE
jgi:hypothetical protein